MKIGRCNTCDTIPASRKAHPHGGETFGEALRESAGPLAAMLLAVVVVVLVFWAHSAGRFDSAGTEPQYYCRYDPRYGDDC